MAVPDVAHRQGGVFQAKWNAENESLKSPERTTLQKIGWIFSSVFVPFLGEARLAGYAIGLIAKVMLLPSAWFSREFKQQWKQKHQALWYGEIQNKADGVLRRHYTASEHVVLTPDGETLAATHFRHVAADASTPTIVCFQPNGTIKDQNIYRGFLEYAIQKRAPCNLVIFDYRTVGDPRGSFQGAKDLVVDGSSIVQWVHDATNGLGVPKHKIYFYGMSLGGATATLTQALDPSLTGNHGNERSFSSISAMVHQILAPTRLRCLSSLIAWIVKAQGYEMDVLPSFQKLQGRIAVIFHPDDPVIPYGPSLARGVTNLSHERIQLEERPEHRAEITRSNHHCAPLGWYSVAGSDESAIDRIGDFMLELQPVAAR